VTGNAFRGPGIFVFIALFGAGAAVAQQDGPAGIAIEPFIVYPGIDFALGRDDNLFSSDINKKSSTLFLTSPWVRVEGKPGPHRFDLIFRSDIGRYKDSSDDNYEDYSLVANGQAVFSARTDLKAHAEYIYGHDPRGSTDRPFATKPDEFVNAGAEATLGFGALGARGRVEASGGIYTRQYQNNSTFTEASDRDTGIFGGTFLWRVAPRSQLLFQAERRHIDYDLPASTLDSDETRYYVGARWDATALTSGTAKFGALRKKFDSDARQDVSTGSWDVGVRWSPLTYSVFDLNTSRQTNESTGVGDTIVSSNYTVTWTHAWSSRVRSQVFGNWRNDDFRGAGVTREDDTGTLGLRLYYQFRRWLRFGTEYTHTDRASTDPAFDYKRNLILFTVGATL
jgi:polysaccharide biosynthesis protein VpsM